MQLLYIEKQPDPTSHRLTTYYQGADSDLTIEQVKVKIDAARVELARLREQHDAAILAKEGISVLAPISKEMLKIREVAVSDTDCFFIDLDTEEYEVVHLIDWFNDIRIVQS